jgi:hypothetical protein
MDVHGTRLARTLFTIATGVERGAALQRDGADSSIPGDKRPPSQTGICVLIAVFFLPLLVR